MILQVVLHGELVPSDSISKGFSGLSEFGEEPQIRVESEDLVPVVLVSVVEGVFLGNLETGYFLFLFLHCFDGGRIVKEQLDMEVEEVGYNYREEDRNYDPDYLKSEIR